jgi:hypothetical protein
MAISVCRTALLPSGRGCRTSKVALWSTTMLFVSSVTKHTTCLPSGIMHPLLHEHKKRRISQADIVLDVMNVRADNPAISYKRRFLNQASQVPSRDSTNTRNAEMDYVLRYCHFLCRSCPPWAERQLSSRKCQPLRIGVFKWLNIQSISLTVMSHSQFLEHLLVALMKANESPFE